MPCLLKQSFCGVCFMIHVLCVPRFSMAALQPILGVGPTFPFCGWRMSAWVIVGSYPERREALCCSQTNLLESMCAPKSLIHTAAIVRAVSNSLRTITTAPRALLPVLKRKWLSDSHFWRGASLKLCHHMKSFIILCISTLFYSAFDQSGDRIRILSLVKFLEKRLLSCTAGPDGQQGGCVERDWNPGAALCSSLALWPWMHYLTHLPSLSCAWKGVAIAYRDAWGGRVKHLDQCPVFWLHFA